MHDGDARDVSGSLMSSLRGYTTHRCIMSILRAQLFNDVSSRSEFGGCTKICARTKEGERERQRESVTQHDDRFSIAAYTSDAAAVDALLSLRSLSPGASLRA